MVLEMTARKKHPYATFNLMYAPLWDAVSVPVSLHIIYLGSAIPS